MTGVRRRAGALLAVVVLSGILAVPGTVPVWAQPPPSLVVRFLDAGQGEATWVRTPSGVSMVVDCGPPSFGRQLVLRLQSAGVTQVDILALTSPRADVVGGCTELLRRMPVGRLVWNGTASSAPGWETLSTMIGPLTQVSQVHAGDVVLLEDPVRVSVLNPPTGAGPLDDYDDSLVLMLEYGPSRVVLAGDIHARGEEQVIAAARDASLPLAPISVLRMADHGAAGTSSPGFINAIGPLSYAVVSYSSQLGMPAPDAEIMRRVGSSATLVSTAEHGVLTFALMPDGSPPAVDVQY